MVFPKLIETTGIVFLFLTRIICGQNIDSMLPTAHNRFRYMQWALNLICE